MTDSTGAEKYLAGRLADPVYRAAYEAALAKIRNTEPRINVAAARNFADGYRQDGMTTAARAIDDLLDRLEHLEKRLAECVAAEPSDAD